MLSAWRKMRRTQKVFVLGWCAFLIVAETFAMKVLTDEQRANRDAESPPHRASVDAAGEPRRLRTPPPGHEDDVPATVTVGVFLDRIPAWSITDSRWQADFYVWFTWDRNHLDPGTTFKIVDGEILTRTLLLRQDFGDQHYALYRVVADITKAFSLTRFPRDDQELTIALEDQGLQSYQLAYLANAAGSTFSPRVTVSGYAIRGTSTLVRPHSYKSTMGNPSLPPNYMATYSEFVFAVNLVRPSWGLFFKMFLALYISMALALAGLWLRSTAERLALGGTALFVAIMNAEAMAPLIPNTGISTLADVINGVGYMSIGAVIVQAIVYQNHFVEKEGQEAAAHVFDRLSFLLLAILFVALNVGILWAAASLG